jgi:hypothetical protein
MVNFLKAGVLLVLGIIGGTALLEIVPRIADFAVSIQLIIYLSLAILLYVGYELLERRF